MFGLMNVTTCHKDEEQLYRRRLLYCGTCKAIGSLYGHPARMVLNNDVVFLTELLLAISGSETELSSWSPEFQSLNCLTLPDVSSVPRELKIASSVSMLLLELKLDDHVEDSGSPLFLGAQQYFSSVFVQSSEELTVLGFPLESISLWFNQQVARERGAVKNLTPVERLLHFAEPTATITSLVFEHSAAIIGGTDEKTAAMRRLGFNFGSLIYLIDALEDIQRDFRTKSFNAISSSFEFNSASAPAEVIAEVENLTIKTVGALLEDLALLKLDTKLQQEYENRLISNVRRKTGFDLELVIPMVSSTKSAAAPCSHTHRESLSRWSMACARAEQLSNQVETHCAPTVVRFFYVSFRSFVYVFVLSSALLSPVQARSIKSYRECFELPFNLIFWGSAFGSLIDAATTSIVGVTRKGFAYAFAMEGNTNGGAKKTLASKTTISTNSSQYGSSPDESPTQKGVNNQDRYRRSRDHTARPATCWAPCCCDSGCEIFGDCCLPTDACCETCAHCNAGAECCAGGECCAGADACAGAGECCGSGGADCCASADCCGAAGDCAGGCSSC